MLYELSSVLAISQQFIKVAQIYLALTNELTDPDCSMALNIGVNRHFARHHLYMFILTFSAAFTLSRGVKMNATCTFVMLKRLQGIN